MPINVIRHSLSEANNRENRGTPAFGHKDAPLMSEGRKLVHDMLVPDLARRGIVPALSRVATSQLLRTQQTAKEAGFSPKLMTFYSCLDEVVEHGMKGEVLRELLDSGGLPDAALRAGELILENPPEENVWFSHGLVIAGLCKVLEIDHQYERLVPRFCELRVLPI